MSLRRVSGYWPFGVLCAVLSTRWMLADAWPGTVSSVSSQAVAAAVAGLGCLAVVLVRKEASAERRGEYLRATVAGALLFAGLNAGLLVGSGGPRASDLMIALALIYVLAVEVLRQLIRACVKPSAIRVSTSISRRSGSCCLLAAVVVTAFTTAGKAARPWPPVPG